MSRERTQRDGEFEKRLPELERWLDELCGQLIGLVDRLLLEHGFDPKTRKFDDQPDPRIETNQQSQKLTLPTSPAVESSVLYNVSKPLVGERGRRKAPNPFGKTVPPCPICGVNPHNWSIHEEWRHTRGAKGAEKLAADREAYPAHTCVDQPILPCPACLKWTGGGFATAMNNSQRFPGTTDEAAEEAMQYDISGYVAMVRVRLVDQWALTTWIGALRNRLHELPKQKARQQLPVRQDEVKPRNRDRRVDLEKRQRTAEMSPEELQRELLTSAVTGLQNRRAFDEAGAANAVAMSDVDGLKALNDKYGYDAGDALLKAKAVALREAQLEAYHDKGDEFLYRGDSIEELQAELERARGILRSHTIVVQRPDGSTLRFTGADFSYGIGKDIAQAETRLKNHKAERKARGELKRGELRGIIKRGRRKPPVY